ncbi:pilus assembly protein [Clostridiaceae bacterium M8S5]|nr:pilus assembly protein [Clostridiaceae bacterium M8S5]
MESLLSAKGSLTVEAAIVFPVVLFVIFIMLFMCFMLYQNAYLQSIADDIAHISASNWNNVAKLQEHINNDLKCSLSLYSNSKLYWNIYDTNGNDKLCLIKQYANNCMRIGNVIDGKLPEQYRVEINLKNYVVYREINVVIRDSYKLPFRGFCKLFKINEVYMIRKKAKAIINDNAEFLRNVDFMLDVSDQLGILESYKETMQKIRANMDKFFD